MLNKWVELLITYAIAWGGMSPKNPLPKEKLLEEYDYVIGIDVLLYLLVGLMS